MVRKISVEYCPIGLGLLERANLKQHTSNPEDIKIFFKLLSKGEINKILNRT